MNRDDLASDLAAVQACFESSNSGFHDLWDAIEAAHEAIDLLVSGGGRRSAQESREWLAKARKKLELAPVGVAMAELDRLLCRVVEAHDRAQPPSDFGSQGPHSGPGAAHRSRDYLIEEPELPGLDEVVADLGDEIDELEGAMQEWLPRSTTLSSTPAQCRELLSFPAGLPEEVTRPLGHDEGTRLDRLRSPIWDWQEEAKTPRMRGFPRRPEPALRTDEHTEPMSPWVWSTWTKGIRHD